MVPGIVRRVQTVVSLLLRQRHLRAGAGCHGSGPQQAQPATAGFHLLGMGDRGCGGWRNARRGVRVRGSRTPLRTGNGAGRKSLRKVDFRRSGQASRRQQLYRVPIIEPRWHTWEAPASTPAEVLPWRSARSRAAPPLRIMSTAEPDDCRAANRDADVVGIKPYRSDVDSLRGKRSA